MVVTKNWEFSSSVRSLSSVSFFDWEVYVRLDVLDEADLHDVLVEPLLNPLLVDQSAFVENLPDVGLLLLELELVLLNHLYNRLNLFPFPQSHQTSFLSTHIIAFLI